MSKRRVTVTIDDDMLEKTSSAVTQGRAESVSAMQPWQPWRTTMIKSSPPTPPTSQHWLLRAGSGSTSSVPDGQANIFTRDEQHGLAWSLQCFPQKTVEKPAS